jgi:hypothetical protein
MGLDLDYDDVVGKEEVHAKISGQMIYSSHFRLLLSPRKSGYSGELFITDSYLCFKGRARTIEIVAIWLIILSIIISLPLILIFLNSYPLGETLLYTVGFQIFGIVVMTIPFIKFYLGYRKLNRGIVWEQNRVEIEGTSNRLTIKEGKKETAILLGGEVGNIIKLQSTLPVVFEISNLSKLDYHDKLAVLEERYKAGKISKELYEELKKKLPYIQDEDSPQSSDPS